MATQLSSKLFSLRSRHSLFSFLLAFLFSLILTGCADEESVGCGSGNSDTRDYYTVRLYDANLELSRSINVEKGQTVNLRQIAKDYSVPSSLYVIDNLTHTASDISYSVKADVSITSDMNLYAAPNVKEIRTEKELDAIRSDLGGSYILLNDIMLTSATLGANGWKPISGFTGVLNGNGCKISGLWTNQPSTTHVGFFKTISNAEIKNLGVVIDNSKGGVRGFSIVGGIAGHVTSSSITNSYSIGDVSGTHEIVGTIGGIAGKLFSYSNITNSYSKGYISGREFVGGIVGEVDLYCNIANSYSTGDINGGSSTGGIVGSVIRSSSIANSYSTGRIIGKANTGGIAGAIYGSSIKNSYSTGDVNGSVGVGGITGMALTSSVTNSYSTGRIGGSSSEIGGIVGGAFDSTIQYNAAINPLVSGNSKTNRIAGTMSSNSKVSNNFASNTMSVKGKSTTGSEGDGKLVTDFLSQSTYEKLKWQFGSNDNAPWKIEKHKNNGSPYLYWQAW
jgi:hypothetical protein